MESPQEHAMGSNASAEHVATVRQSKEKPVPVIDTKTESKANTQHRIKSKTEQNEQKTTTTIDSEKNENKSEINDKQDGYRNEQQSEGKDVTNDAKDGSTDAYRDTDGNIKIYEDGNEPTILVKDYSGDELKEVNDETTVNVTDTEKQDGTADLGDDEERDTIAEELYPKLSRDNYHDANEVVGTNKVIDTARIIGRRDDVDILTAKPEPPNVRRRDLIPDEDFFTEIDAYAIKAPKSIKEKLTSLVAYLIEIAESPLERVRAFYVWITHNINYDTSGYFGRATLQATDPASVLQNRLTVCEGYTRLMKALCREVGIPVKMISGYVKAYGYTAGNDVTEDKHNAHAWNAVFLENNWFLIDVTWGAGYVKAQQKAYVPKYNDVYFLTDPELFATDHFPWMNNDVNNSEPWQLLQKPLSKQQFIDILNMDKHGKQWGIEAISHKYGIVSYIQHELDIHIQHTYEPMSDYLAYLYKDDRKLDQFTYTYKVDTRLANVHVCMPAEGEYSVQIYGRRKVDSADSNFQPLMKYVLYCTEAYESPAPYPSNHTIYGPVTDLETYGISDAGAVYRIAEEGEMTIALTTTRYVDPLPKLYYGDNNVDLRAYSLVHFSEDVRNLSVHLRFPYIGYFKLVLFAKQHHAADGHLKPFVTYLIQSKMAAREGVFPVSHETALKYRCCLLEPLTKEIPAKTEICIRINSRLLAGVKGHKTYIKRKDKMQFEGKAMSPEANSQFVIYGAGETESVLHPLFIFNTV